MSEADIPDLVTTTLGKRKTTTHQWKAMLAHWFYNLSPVVRLNILAGIVGLVGGLGSYLFRWTIFLVFTVLFDIPRKFLASQNSSLEWLPFLITPIIGGLFVGLLTSKVSAEVKGHGVPEVLEAVALRNGRMKLRIPFIKIIASATTIGTGGSAGREGPIAQIGAGFASLIGQKLDLNNKEIRVLVVSGVAAGISATFNAPIGGSLFAIEVLLGDSGVAFFIPIILASVVGTITGQFLLGDEPAFIGYEPTNLKYQDPSLIPMFVVLAIVCGVISAIWIRGFYRSEDLIKDLFTRSKVHPIVQPAIGGALVGVLLVITLFVAGDNWQNYTVMGRTYLPMDAVFDGTLTTGAVELVVGTLVLLFVLKAVATVLTIGTGGSGGVFAPTLFLGVMLGAIVAILGQVDVALFALLGMAAFFAGTGRAPLTAVIMTAEMTGDYFVSIPLMLVVTISWLVSTKIEPNDIYVLKLIRRGVNIGETRTDVLEDIEVSRAMTSRDKLVVVHTKTRLEQVLDLFRETKHEGYPVFDEEDEFVGVITISEVERGLKDHPKDWNVQNILDQQQNQGATRIFCTDSGASLMTAIAIMERHDISRLPVVRTVEGKTELVGWLTNHDITNCYIQRRAQKSLQEVEEHLFSLPVHPGQKQKE